MEAHVCLNCGAPLNKEGQIYQCPYCRATYEDDAEERASVTLKSLLDERKVEQYSRAKRVLYTAVHAQYPSSEEVLSAARAVLAIEDQDVLANVYVFSHDEDPYRLNPYLTSLHVTKPEADEILRWLVPSLHVRTGPAIKAFIERHYADAEFTRRITEVEDAIEKLDEGVYEATLMRDVFVAYSSADLEKAIHVVNLIEENGLSCFLASRNLRHGKGAAENYLIRLKEAMNSCAVFLFLSSPNSLSATCDAIRVELPYLVQNCPDKPRIQYIIKDTPHVPFIVSRTLKTAFPEQEWCRDEEDLLTRIFDHLEAKPSKAELERQRLEEERRQLEAEKARIAAEAEAERKRLEEERQRIQAEAETARRNVGHERQSAQPRRAATSTQSASAHGPIPKGKVKGGNGTLTFTPQKDNTYAVSDGTKPASGRLIIPSECNGFPVSKIADRGFQHGSFDSVIIPEGVVTIGEMAFWDCRSLEYVELPSTLKTIGTMAFNGTALTSVDFPEGLEKIGSSAFSSVSLRAVKLPRSVIHVDPGAFSDEKGLLKSIEVEPGSKYYVSKNGILYTADMKTLVCHPSGHPDKNFDIPAGVERILLGACGYSLNLQSVTVPEGVTEIGNYSFGGCISLRSIDLPSTLQKVDEYAFASSSLQSVTITEGKNTEKIKKYILASCPKAKITVRPGKGKPSVSSSGKKSPMDRLPEGFRPIVKQMAEQARHSPFAQTMMMVKDSLSMLAQSIMAGSRGRISIDAAIGIAVTIMGRALIVGGKEPSLLTVTGIADAIGTSQYQIQDVVNANRDGRKYQEIWSQLGEVDASTGRALLSFATQCVVLDGEPNKAQVDFLLDILQRIGFN